MPGKKSKRKKGKQPDGKIKATEEGEQEQEEGDEDETHVEGEQEQEEGDEDETHVEGEQEQVEGDEDETHVEGEQEQEEGDEDETRVAEPTVKEMSDDEKERTKLMEELGHLKIRLKKVETFIESQAEKPTELKPELEVPPPPFVLKESRFKEGLQWYPLDKKGVDLTSDIKYSKWYDSILELMQANKAYVYDNALFVKAECDSIFTFCSHNKNEVSQDQLVFNIFEKGWTHEATKFLLVLHPREPKNSIEMDEDEATEGKHSWTVQEIDDDYFTMNDQLIICGRK